jgi:hypothetical protein
MLFSFPIEHYGKLYGVCKTIGAVISLLQYPAIVLIDGPSNGNPYWVSDVHYVHRYHSKKVREFSVLKNSRIFCWKTGAEPP